MKKRYRTSDGGVYEISDAEVNDFMTDFPDAIEVETYDADGEEYDISADEVSAFMTDFPGAVKKKGVSGQGSDPLTQSLPVKTVPAKVAAKGAAPVTSTPKGTSKMAAAGDPFAQQQAQPSALMYDPSKVRSAVKAAKEGIEKTYEIAKEGKRKPFYASWNTQQAYSYIKPSIDQTEQMLAQIKDVQDPEIQSIYNELKNINDQMKNQVGQAWNDNWSEETLSKYVGNLAGMAREKANEVDRRMSQLQQPTQQQQQAQQAFQKAEVKAPKKQPLPAKTEEQIKEEEQIAAMPQTVGLPTDEEIVAQEEDLTYPEKRESYKKRFESTPWLKARYGDYENFELLNNVDKAIKGGDDESVVGLFDERNTKAKGEVLDATMGKRHKEVNFAGIQDVFDQVFDRYSESSRVDPQGEETKSLAGDLRVAEMELNNAYEGLDLDYLESQKTVRPTKAAEDLDKYQILTAKQKAGEDLDDDQKQFLLDTRRESLNAYATVASSKISKIKETSDVNGYAAGMAELTPLIQEVVGNQDLVKYSSEQQMKLANAAKAPIQEEYGKKRDQLAEYEEQLKNIDFQFEQLDAEYQSGSKNQQQYESDFNQLQSIRNEIYGSYETTYNALEELNKAMETAISPFNNEINNIQDPYNKKVQELNNKISELKRKTNVDDSVLAQLDLLYRDLAIADKGAKTVNAQYAGQFYSEELNKMLQEDRKTGANIFSEGMRGFVNGMSKMVTGAMKLPKAIGLEDSEKFGFVDEWYANAMQIEKQSSGTFGALSGKDVPKSLQLAYDIAGATASIANYSITGGVPLNPLLTSAATTFILSAGDNYQRAVDVGFDTNSAQLFSNLMTLSQAGAEMIYRDVEVFDDVIGNTLLRNVMKNGLTWKQAARVAIQNLPRNTAKLTEANLMETLEEGTSMVAENLALNTTNAVAGKKYFDDNLSVEGATDMLITTFASTSLTRLIGSSSKLDPSSRMALFKAVSDKEKVLQNLERVSLDKSKIAQVKKDLDEAKLKLSVVESHSNWKAMNDEQKAYAFDLARQLDELEKAKKSNTENKIRDESVDQQTEQVREELNEALNNPDAVQEQEQIKSNTFEVLEAVKNGEDYPQKLSEHPNWAKLTDEQKKEIDSLSEDLEEKQREILSLYEVGVESSTTVEQRNNIESKIADILNNPTNDQKNVEGVSGEVREGKEPVTTEPVSGEGEGQAEAGGVLQTPGQEEVTPTEEATPEAAPELSPEMTKIEEKRAAEIEAFDNDENLTEIDGEQVLLTPEGRITRDTINEKYDKQASFQAEVDKAVAEVKKQQDPAYQAALTEAIAVDPQADTRVHQIAAENILNGATATDAMATAAEQAAKEARTEKARRAMQDEGLLSGKEDIQKAFKNITRALRSTGIRVRDPLPPDQFEEERKKAGASDTAEGWFRSKTGEIVFSQKALDEGWGTTIIFHEGTHPILNIIRNTDKKLYDKAVQGLKAAAKSQTVNGKPNPLKAVEEWVQKAAGKKSQEQQDDEFLTETIARIAAGEMEINQIPRNAREKFIDAMNKIAKFMGFKRIFFNSPDTEFRRLANQIATTLAKGEKVENIVGKRNVKKYHAKFVQPRAIELLMGKENLSKYGLEPGKKYNVRQIYEAFEKRQKDLFGQIDRKDYSEKTMKQLAEWAKDEVVFMMTQFPDESGTGWYTTKFQAALDEVAKIFPEIGTDPGQRSLFTMLVAIYSDGTKVEKNMSNAIMAYSDYRKTGVIPNTDTGGERNASFNGNINEINRLIAEFDGDFEAMTKYLLEEKSGSELAKEAKENGEEFSTDWPADMILPVASRVFGPKLGMFYSNLMGKEGYPTLDRWFSRLFNRYRGDLMPRLTGLKGKEKDTKGELQGVARFKSFIGKPGISDSKAIEAAKERALQFGSRTKLGDASKASKMLSPIEKKVGMKQGADKASKEKFKKAAKAAGIKLTSPEFKAHEQFVKDRTGGFWTELEGKVGFKQGSKTDQKQRFDEAAAKLGFDPESKLYKNHLADKAANTIYKAAFVSLNDAPFNRTDRKFMFDTLVEARKMLKKEGVDVTVADIQAILWYYEKKLYVSQGGLESAMGISYQEAAENSVEEYNQNGGKLDTEVTQDDLIDEDGETDLEGEVIQPSEKVGRGPKTKGNLVEGTYYQSGLTEDKNDYVFFHVSSAPEASIRKGIDSTKYTSLRTAREEKGLQYGVASYYTRPEDGERMVGGEKYAVRVPKDKVYPIDSDPNGYGEKAEAKIPQGTPFRGEAVKREIADMAKNDGYQMIVGEWSYSRTGKPAGELPEFRADALVPLKPTKEKTDSFTSNAEKGMERIAFPGQQSEEAKQELGNLASEVRDIMSAKKKFSSKEYSLADDVYLSGQVRENKYEDDEFNRDITPEEYDIMTKVLPKSMQAEAARVRELLFGGKVQESVNIPRGVKQFAKNVSSTIDRIKKSTGEDGATLNLDGTTYKDGGLVVPASSFNVSQDGVSANGLFDFLKNNEGNISSNIFKIGLYRFPDRPEVSYDLNIVIPRQYRDVALAFGKLAGQESLFDLDTFENIKTGADGKNPRQFTAQELADIARDLSEGRVPKIVAPTGDQRIADALGMNDTIQPSDADRGERSEYVQALDEMGFTEEQIEDWRKENSVSQRQSRVPGVQQSAQELSEGKKNVYEHIETVKELQPIKPFTKVPKIPSFLDVVASLKSNQVVEGIVGLTKTIANGMRVGLRLDIPAYDSYDTWVVSLHDGVGDNPAGKKIAYGKTGVIRNVNFVTSSTGSLNIARGKSNKATIARMFGDWVNESPESVQARAEQLMNDPAWVQVGMNPFRHSWFYDKNDGMPVVSAEEVIQVGALVLAKNTRKLDLNNEQDRAEFEEKFKVKIPTGETVQFSGDGRYEKNDIPDLIERAINGIDADLAKGISLTDAIERNITNQPWYPLVTDKQRKSIQNVIESTYDQEIAAMSQTETQEAAPVADSKTTSLASELADLYYQIRDGRRTERNQAEVRRDEILRGNPKLSYIYKNISLINAQLEARGLLTKSTGCP